MSYSFDMPRSMSNANEPNTSCVLRRSSFRLARVFRHATLALSLPAALLIGAAIPTAQPVAVETAPVTASVELTARPAAEGSLALGTPRTLNPTVGTVTAYALNVRSGPGTGFAVITTVARGTQATVIGQSGGWYNIRLASGRTGWVSGQYFRVGGTTTAATAPAPSASNVVAIARRYVGYPYVYGAAGPNAFDCSGFTQFVYRQVGISLTRSAASQYNTPGTRVRSYSALQPGDLMFFANTAGPGITHVGIYAGNGQMIHAGTSRTGVNITNINYTYWTSHFAGAVRPYR